MLLLFLLAVAIGFAMENLKVNINYILERGGAIPGFFEQDAATKRDWLDGNRVLNPYDYYYNHSRIEWLFNFSEGGLIRLKWFNSVFFTVIFMMINATMMLLITRDRSFFRWTIVFYAIFFSLSYMIYMIGKLTGTLNHAYAVSRKLAGALQSMVPLMILWPSSWLIRKQKMNIDD
jgi:hypothetical protein